MINQHTILHRMLEPGLATVTAVKSGNWNDKTVWSTKFVPNWNSTAFIPSGIVVTIDSIVTVPVNRIGIEGTLRFAHDKNTQLIVDTINIGHDGLLEIGTVLNPVQDDKTAKVIFKVAKVLDRAEDPFFVSRGLNVMGDISIHGRKVNPYVQIESIDGDLVVLTEDPKTWKPGDSVVIPGTNSYQYQVARGPQDEVRVIKYVNKNRIRFSAPLLKTHVLPNRPGLKFHAANLTRNISFSSYDKTKTDSRGHIMIMKAPKTPIVGASFVSLGRTDKSFIINDAEIDANDKLVPGTGTNMRARYSFHFHQVGTVPEKKCIVDDCVVEDVIGWGFVNHQSNVDFINCVAYKGKGALFLTESGDETGSFRHCMAIRCDTAIVPAYEKTLPFQARLIINDWGTVGSGFWLQGSLVSVDDSVATGCSSGFGYYGTGTSIPPIPVANIPGANPADYGNNVSVLNGKIPFKWNNLHSYHCGYGAIVQGSSPYGLLQSEIRNCRFWSVRQGIWSAYTNKTLVADTHILADLQFINGDPKGMNKESAYEEGINRDWPFDMTYQRCRIEGFGIGMQAPGYGYNVIEDCYWDNVINVAIKMNTEPRNIMFTRNTVGGTRTKYLLDIEKLTLPSFELWWTIYPYMSDPNATRTTFYSDVIMLDDKQVYTQVHEPDFKFNGYWTELNGKTNSELNELYGEMIGGCITPSDAVADPRVKGGKVSTTLQGPRAEFFTFFYKTLYLRKSFTPKCTTRNTTPDRGSYKVIDFTYGLNFVPGKTLIVPFEFEGVRRTAFHQVPSA